MVCTWPQQWEGTRCLSNSLPRRGNNYREISHWYFCFLTKNLKTADHCMFFSQLVVKSLRFERHPPLQQWHQHLELHPLWRTWSPNPHSHPCLSPKPNALPITFAFVSSSSRSFRKDLHNLLVVVFSPRAAALFFWGEEQPAPYLVETICCVEGIPGKSWGTEKFFLSLDLNIFKWPSL